MTADARPIVENRPARPPRSPAEIVRAARICAAIVAGRTIERSFAGEPGWHAIPADEALQLVTDRMELWLRVAPASVEQERRR